MPTHEQITRDDTQPVSVFKETVFVQRYPVFNKTLSNFKEDSSLFKVTVSWFGAEREEADARAGSARESSTFATQGQIDGFLSQLPYKCLQNRVGSVGDLLKFCS